MANRVFVDTASGFVDLLAEGMTSEQIVEQYHGIEADDVRASMAYAAEMTRERLIVTGHDVA